MTKCEKVLNLFTKGTSLCLVILILATSLIFRGTILIHEGNFLTMRLMVILLVLLVIVCLLLTLILLIKRRHIDGWQELVYPVIALAVAFISLKM